MAKLCLACMFVCANICSSDGALITENLLSASFFWQRMSSDIFYFIFSLIRKLSWWREYHWYSPSVCDSCVQPLAKGMAFLNITSWILEACRVSWPSECSLAMWHSVAMTSRQSDSLRHRRFEHTHNQQWLMVPQSQLSLVFISLTDTQENSHSQSFACTDYTVSRMAQLIARTP